MQLFISLIGMPQRIAQGKIVVQISRYAAVIDNIQRRTNYNGGNPIGFKGSGRQTDGLMANGSQGYENRDIDFIFLASL